jgi:hypothetical protein
MGVQMGEMSKLGWPDGLAETCGRIPCISCIWCLVQSARPSLLSNIVCGLRMHVGLNKNRTMGNVQKHSSYINIPSSQTFRSCLHNKYGPGIYPKFRKCEIIKIQLAKTSNRLTFLVKCKVHDVPKGLMMKARDHNHRSSKITLGAI